MPVSLPIVLISFSVLIDLKEMPIDEYNRQLLPESKSTQMGNPAWMICKDAMYGHVAAYFLSKRFYSLDTCVIFLRLFHSAFNSFHSAFIFCQGTLSQRFYSNLSKCRKALYHSAFTQFFLSASKCLFFILLSMEQCPIFYFKICISFYFNFLMWSA